MATKKTKQPQDLVPPPKAPRSRPPQYPPFDVDKRQANMLSGSIDEATAFLGQLTATLADRRQRMKLSPKELKIVSAIIANFAPEQGWPQDEIDHLSTSLTGGAGTSGDGKEIGTLPH